MTKRKSVPQKKTTTKRKIADKKPTDAKLRQKAVAAALKRVKDAFPKGIVTAEELGPVSDENAAAMEKGNPTFGLRGGYPSAEQLETLPPSLLPTAFSDDDVIPVASGSETLMDEIEETLNKGREFSNFVTTVVRWDFRLIGKLKDFLTVKAESFNSPK